MARAIRAVTVERGRDPRDLTLMAFGGNGGVHALDLARQLGIPRVVVPPMSGVFSAVGMLACDVEHIALAHRRAAPRRDDGRRAQRDQGRTWQTEVVGAARRRRLSRPSDCACLWEADLRHEGQATELTVRVRRRRLRATCASASSPNTSRPTAIATTTPIELMKVRVVGRGLRENRLDFGDMKIATARRRLGAAASRSVSFARGEPAVAVPIVDRRALGRAAAAGAADHRGVRRHHRGAAGRHACTGCDRLHRSGV